VIIQQQRTADATMGLDTRGLRNALGAFATGVTIVTARRLDGTDIGLTANSFSSVSLEPPMVLWSLAKTSSNIEPFRAARYFAVHILSADQDALSAQFTSKVGERFRGLDVGRGRDGSRCSTIAPRSSSAGQPSNTRAATTSSSWVR